MRTRVGDMLARSVLLLLALAACDKPKQEAPPAASARAATTSAPAAQPPAEPPPGGCKAMGRQRVELATALGTAHGLVADKSHLYLTTWQIYGSRGDVLRIRKDGGGNIALASLELQPRGLAVDDNYVFFTEGIRLKRVQNKRGGVVAMADAKFSSQAIALGGDAIYGVPGDYGPYDRVVKLAKAGGVSTELADGPRPDVKKGPVGYSALAVDTTGIYVTDSGHGRVLKVALEGGNPTTLAGRQRQVFDLALVGSHLYFTLAKQGKIRRVSKAGGAVTEIASGLVEDARIAADSKIVVGTFSGGEEGAPVELAKVPAEGGPRAAITSIAASNTVEALTLDDDCVYWVERESGAGKLMVYGRAR